MTNNKDVFLYILFKNEFFFFIYEIFFIFSLFFLIIVGIFLSNIKYLKNYYANFYNFYYIILFLLIIYGFLLYVFNIINYDYSLFLLTYSIDPLIYVGKVIFFMLVILFLIAFRFYIKLIKVYNFEIFFLLACSILGLFLLLSSSDFINMYLCIELYSLSMYSFMAHFKRRLINIEAAFKYFIVGSISSSFILFSISGIYAILGSFNFYDIELLLYYNSVAPYNYISNVLIHFFSYLIIISFFIKIGAAPLHLWFIDIYAGAPLIVTFFLIVVSKFTFVFYLFYLLNFVFYSLYSFWKLLILIILISSLVTGYLGALYQLKIKKIIAYSSLSNVALFLSLYSIISTYSIILFTLVLFIYFVNIGALFYSIFSTYSINTKGFIKKIYHFKSLFYINRPLSIFLTIAIFSLASLPPFLGFFTKFFVLLLLADGSFFNYLIILLILVGGVISIVYYLRLVKIITVNNFINFIFFYKVDFYIAFILSFISLLLIFMVLGIDMLLEFLLYILNDLFIY